jgi:hypothetical protein
MFSSLLPFLQYLDVFLVPVWRENLACTGHIPFSVLVWFTITFLDECRLVHSLDVAVVIFVTMHESSVFFLPLDDDVFLVIKAIVEIVIQIPFVGGSESGKSGVKDTALITGSISLIHSSNRYKKM